MNISAESCVKAPERLSTSLSSHGFNVDSACCTGKSVLRASVLKEPVNDDMFAQKLSSSSTITLGSDKTSVWWGRTFLEMNFKEVASDGVYNHCLVKHMRKYK